ncbi:MAG: MlaD family protein [Planctomycetota bacterium]
MTETKKMEMAIGTFVIAAGLVVALLILFLGDTFNPFRETYTVVVHINHVGDLRTGAPVKLGGVRIGRVKDISLPKGGAILVTATIDKTVPLNDRTEAMIATSGLVGDTFLEFTSAEGAPLPTEGTLTVQGRGPVKTEEILMQVRDIGVNVQALVKDLTDVIGEEQFKQNIHDTVQNTAGATQAAERFLLDLQRTSENIYAASDDIRKTADTVRGMSEDIKNTVVKTLTNPENVESVQQALANVRKSSEDAVELTRRLDNIFSRADELFSDEEPKIRASVENVNAIVEDLRGKLAMIDPNKGILKYFTTEEFNQKIESVFGELTSLVKNVNSLFAGTTRIEFFRSYVQGSRLASRRERELVRLGMRTVKEQEDEEYRAEQERMKGRGVELPEILAGPEEGSSQP